MVLPKAKAEVVVCFQYDASKAVNDFGDDMILSHIACVKAKCGRFEHLVQYMQHTFPDHDHHRDLQTLVELINLLQHLTLECNQ